MTDLKEDGRVKQVGPSLHLKATCFSCRYERSESYRVQGDSGHDVYCDHPAQPGRTVGDSRWDTPDWCPEGAQMLALREALAAPSPKDQSHG